MKILLFLLPFVCLLACSPDASSREAKQDDDENEVATSLVDLPEKIRQDINTRFTNAELREADRLTDADGNAMYEVQFRHNGRIMEARYKPDGRLLGFEEEGPEEESDDDDDL